MTAWCPTVKEGVLSSNGGTMAPLVTPRFNKAPARDAPSAIHPKQNLPMFDSNSH